MSNERLSIDSLSEATRSRAKFSGHGNAKGAAGYRTDGEVVGAFLRQTGETAIVNPHEHGYGTIRISAAWDNVRVEKAGFFRRLLKKATAQGVDIDLGCLYELADGHRGVVQAFGNHYGSYDVLPWVAHSGDEKTGNRTGEDEYILINGAHWSAVKRILVYVYIYGGVPSWAALQPRIRIGVPGEDALVAVPGVHKGELPVCVIAGLENVRDGIRMTNYSEYFPGHAEMDRAFGFGIEWTDGRK